MDNEEVLTALKEAGTAQNIKVYRRHGAKRGLYGVSFANFKKIKKQIISSEGKKGFNQEIAEKLWLADNTDAQILACMIAEPKKIAKETIQLWSKSIDSTMISNPFADLLYKSPFKDHFLQEWLNHPNQYLARIPYSLISLTAKNEEKEDAFFYPYIELAEKNIHTSQNWTKEGINGCLISIGGRNDALKNRIFEAAETIGTIEIDHGETSCKTFDIKEYVQKIHDKKAQVAGKK